MNASNYSFRLDLSMAANQKAKDAQIELQEEDEFLAQDTSKWDPFDDADKFRRRDEILKRRR